MNKLASLLLVVYATLAFQGTVPLEDQAPGRCDVTTPGSPQLVTVYWSAIRSGVYYYSALVVERGTLFTVKRDDIAPGTYTVTVQSKKLTPGAHLSCPSAIVVTTR